jgi:tetratricopeptide (TPR) repeat protein
LEEALVIFDQVLENRRRMLKPDDDDITIAMRNKAICLREMKQFDALVLFDQVMDKSTSDGIIHDIPDAYRANDKSLCLQEMGHPEEALPLCEQALSINMKAYGPNHPKVAECLITKAQCLDSIQHFNEALDLLNQCLTIRVNVHRGKDHVEVAEVLYFKALCLKHLNQQHEAIQVGQQSLDMYEKLLGSNHPKTVEMRSINWGS